MSHLLGQQSQGSDFIDANTIEAEWRVIDSVGPGKHISTIIYITTGVCKKIKEIFDYIRWPKIQIVKIGTSFEVGGRLYRVVDILDLDCGIGQRIGAVEIFSENSKNIPKKQLFTMEKVLDSMFFKF